MRLTWRFLIASCFFFAALAHGQQGGQSINPGTQIRWPAPSCLLPHGAYLPAVNACQDISKIAPSQITWPVPCNGVYSPSTNTCVPTGTANNPGGLPGQVQINSGGNFAGAVATDIGKAMYDPATTSYLLSNTTPTIGFPFPAGPDGQQPVNEILIGTGAGQNIGNRTPVVLSVTASSGSTTLTVPSVTGIQQYFTVTGPGIAAGTGVATQPMTGATTITISKPTTAAITGGNVSFMPTIGGSLIAIGNGACQACQSNNGSVVIGQGALGSATGMGTDGEDINGVFIGPFAGSSQTTVDACPAGSLQSGGAGVFEPILIGNKVGVSNSGGASCNWSGTQMIGNHIFNIAGSGNTTLIGNEIGSSSTAIVIVPGGVVGIGRNVFSNALRGSSPPAGTYTVSNTNCIGYGNCALAFGSLNFVYGSSSFNGANSGSPVITGSRNDVFGDNIGNNISTGSNNVMIGGGTGSGATAAALTTGTQNVMVGDGAGQAATTASNVTAIGNGAAAGMIANPITAVGVNACQQATGIANICIGYNGGTGLTSGTNDVIIDASTNAGGVGPTGAWSQGVAIGYNSGAGETGTGETYIGSSTGRRNVASAGTNTAIGNNEFLAVSSATGTEQYNAFLGSNSNCTGCTNVISLGQAANLGAVTHAVQMDTGSNSTSHTMQWQTLNWMDDSGNATFKTLSVQTVPSVNSAATVAITSSLTKVLGVAAISNFTPPTVVQNGGSFRGCVKLIPTGAWTTVTGGNIALASTAVVNRVMDMCYDGTSWYPSY